MYNLYCRHNKNIKYMWGWEVEKKMNVRLLIWEEKRPLSDDYRTRDLMPKKP